MMLCVKYIILYVAIIISLRMYLQKFQGGKFYNILGLHYKSMCYESNQTFVDHIKCTSTT